MGILKRYFSGDAVSDADYAAKEVDAEEQEQELVLGSRKYARVAETPPPRQDKVVAFPRAATGTDGAAPAGRATASFTRETAAPYAAREPSGYTREIDSSGPSESRGSFGGGGTGRISMAEAAESYVFFKRLKDFAMASQVADKMVERKIVILNLESCDDEVARRVLDFIGGVAYACSSMVKRIAGRVFIITPKGVSSDGEFFDEIRNAEMDIRYDD